MSNRASALGDTYKTGTFGNLENGTGVILSETFFEFTAEIAAFPSSIKTVEKLVVAAKSKVQTSTAFQIAANRWLVAGSADFRTALETKLPAEDGTLTDLTHGRSAFVISGPKVGWVLSKLFAIDFSLKALPEKTGLATMHHDTFAQIYRSNAETFHIFVFRSFARSFWQTLCHAAEETGYEVV